MTTVKAIRPLDPNALSVSPEDAGRFLSVHRRTVDRLIADRILKARKAGRRVLVDMASIRAYHDSLPLIGGTQ
jgi:excisionase family DNA binding protein